MESERELPDWIPSSQGGKVLRAGVRIVSPSYDPLEAAGPDEITLDEALRSLQDMANKARQGMIDTVAGVRTVLIRSGQIMGYYYSPLPPPPLKPPVTISVEYKENFSNKLRNDGKPKKKRQDEPAYVALTKKKRR